MKLVPVKQAQAKLFNAPADKGLKSLTSGDVQEVTASSPSSATERAGSSSRTASRRSRSPLPPGAAGKRLLKEAFKREFPRSANAYLAEVR